MGFYSGLPCTSVSTRDCVCVSVHIPETFIGSFSPPTASAEWRLRAQYREFGEISPVTCISGTGLQMCAESHWFKAQAQG